MDADIPAACSQLVCSSQLALRCACCCAGWVGFLRKPLCRLCLPAEATPWLQRTPTVRLWRSLRPTDHLRCRLCRAGNQLLAPTGTVFRPDRWASPSHCYRSGRGPLEARCHKPVACPASRAGSGALPPRWPSAACRPTGSCLASESIAAPPPAAAGPWLRPRESALRGLVASSGHVPFARLHGSPSCPCSLLRARQGCPLDPFRLRSATAAQRRHTGVAALRSITSERSSFEAAAAAAASFSARFLSRYRFCFSAFVRASGFGGLPTGRFTFRSGVCLSATSFIAILISVTRYQNPEITGFWRHRSRFNINMA